MSPADKPKITNADNTAALYFLRQLGLTYNNNFLSLLHAQLNRISAGFHLKSKVRKITKLDLFLQKNSKQTKTCRL